MARTLVLVWVVPGFFALLLFVVLIRWLISKEVRENRDQRMLALFVVAMFLIAVNWLAAAYITEWVIGGDALRGKIEGERFYVGSGGEYTEVSARVYWFTYFYVTLSGLAFPVYFIILLSVGYCRHRSRLRWRDDRIRQLRQRNDLQALYELIELLDLPLTVSYFMRPVDLYELRVAIDEKTRAVMTREERIRLLKSKCEELRSEKEMWAAWVRSHEDELCRYLARNRRD